MLYNYVVRYAYVLRCIWRGGRVAEGARLLSE